VNTEPNAENSSISHEILRAIRRVIRKVSDHSRMLSRDVGLTVPQLLCLKAIGESKEDETTLALVAQTVQLSPATTSGIMDRLERDGLVLRERRSKDRRKVCLTLTDRGASLFENLPTPLQDSFVRRLMALSEQERREVLTALQRVVELMEAGDIDAAPILITDDLG
jgi:DNA-binding MarR family transcriptional regulator